MILFLLGFLSCWVIIGIVTIAIDNSWIPDEFWRLVALSGVIVYCPFYFIFKILEIQWYSVGQPITQHRFGEIMDVDTKDKVKYIHIKNFYIILDKKAWWTKKLIFLRVKN